MSVGTHSHWKKYHTRVVSRDNYTYGNPTNSSVINRKEYLQLICEHDGVIFHEVEVKEKN